MNMKKIVLPLFALAIIMSACVKTPEPIRFSILGDSYSSYEGYVHPDSNDVYPYENIGLTGVEQMWWAQVADSTGWILERNNSFSGALMCNYDYVPAPIMMTVLLCLWVITSIPTGPKSSCAIFVRH